ncbi:MAG: hypothetical protein AAB344_08315 [Bacteroidota bacterium]
MEHSLVGLSAILCPPAPLHFACRNIDASSMVMIKNEGELEKNNCLESVESDGAKSIMAKIAQSETEKDIMRRIMNSTGNTGESVLSAVFHAAANQSISISY